MPAFIASAAAMLRSTLMAKSSRHREEYWSNPMVAKLGWRLAAHVPKGKNPWAKTSFEVAIVGA
jgi:hypothetical protein